MVWLQVALNSALAIALVSVIGLLWPRVKSLSERFRNALIGGLFALTALLSTQTALPLAAGGLIDASPVLVALGAFLGGWPAALAAGVPTALFRLDPAGAMIIAGATATGLLFRWLVGTRRLENESPYLAAMGVLLALETWAVAAWLSSPGSEGTFQAAVLPRLLFDPVLAVAIATLFRREVARCRALAELQPARMEAEEELRQSEAAFRTVFEAAPVGIAIVEGRVLQRCNDCLCDMFGYRPQELLGHSPRKLYETEEEFHRVGQELYSEMRERGLGSAETRVRRRDGTPLDIVLIAAPLRWEDPSAGAVVTVHNVTERKSTEEAVRRGEERIKSIFRAAPIGIGVVVNRVLQQVNDRLCEITGYDAEELAGQSARILYPSDEEFEFVGREKYRQIREKGTGTVETRWRRKDGRIIDVLLSSTPLDLDDLSAGVTFTALDITANKRAKEDLQAAREFLETAIGHSPSGILVADAPDVRIRLANTAALGIRGGDSGLLTGIPVEEHALRWQMFRPDGSPYPSEELPLSRAVRGGEVTEGEEIIIRDEAGNERWVSVNASPIRDAHGRITAGIAVFNDLTQRKRAEEAFRESEERFRSMAESSNDHLFQFAADGRTIYSSPAVAQVYGYTPEESMTLTCLDYLHESDRERAAAAFESILAGHKVKNMELAGKRKDGSVVPIEVSAAPILRDGVVVGAQGITRDITERKRAEEELRRSQERLQSIFRTIPAGIGVVADRVVLEVNERVCVITGYAADEILGRTSCHLYTSQEEFERVGREIYQEMRETGTGTRESQWRRKDGTTIDVLLSVALLDPADPKSPSTFTVLDITERKKNAKAIEEQLRFEQLVSQLSASLVNARPEEIDATVERGLDRVRDFFGACRSTVDIFDENRNSLAVFASSQPPGVPSIAGRVLAETFRWYWGQVEAASKQHGDDSRFLVRLDDLPDSLPPEATAEREYCLAGSVRSFLSVYWKRHGKPLSGYSLSSQEEDPWTEQLTDRMRLIGELFVNALVRKKDQEQLANYRNHLEELVEQRTKQLAQAKGAAENALAELRSTQDQLVRSEKLAVLGRLAAGVAHELNTPLGAIGATAGMIRNSYARLLDHTDDLAQWVAQDSGTSLSGMLKVAFESKPLTLSTRERREIRDRLVDELEKRHIRDARSLAELFIDLNLQDSYADWLEEFADLQAQPRAQLVRSFSTVGRGAGLIQVAVEKASRIVRALQTYSKRTPPEEASLVDVRDEIETILTLHHSRFKDDVEIVRQYGDASPVEGFRDELGQVWTNLIFNALQAMDYRGRLTIATRREADDLVVSFEDTGCGIPESLRQRIFEPFFTTKRSGEACGLGLDISRTIIDRHHGRIEVKSTPGEGTTFVVRLPMHQPLAVD